MSDKLNNLVSLELLTTGNELVCEVEMRDIDNDEKHCFLLNNVLTRHKQILHSFLAKDIIHHALLS